MEAIIGLVIKFMNRAILYILALIVVIVGGFAIFTNNNAGENVPPALKFNTYVNEKFGITFDYPEGYVMDEVERGSAKRRHYVISLIREEDREPRLNSEGPTGITLDIYQSDSNRVSAVDWLLKSGDSNFNLSDGTYASTTIDGKDALTYHWSGLYEADSTVFEINEGLVLVTVTYISTDDENSQYFSGSHQPV